jgi:hypothetical protein
LTLVLVANQKAVLLSSYYDYSSNRIFRI